MVAQLYSADLMDIAKPVKKETKRKLKSKPKSVTTASEVDDDVSDRTADNALEIGVKPVKEKKPRSEKQIAAFEKAKETRRLKKEAAHAEKQAQEIAEQEKIQREVEEERIKNEKKQARSEKRKQARLAKVSQTTMESIPEETVESPKFKCGQENHDEPETVQLESEPKPKRQRKKKQEATPASSVDGGEVEHPPEWFKKYIHGVKQEENTQSAEKKTPKQVKSEAHEMAAVHWKDPVNRDRVKSETDSHLNRMVI